MFGRISSLAACGVDVEDVEEAGGPSRKWSFRGSELSFEVANLKVKSCGIEQRALNNVAFAFECSCSSAAPGQLRNWVRARRGGGLHEGTEEVRRSKPAGRTMREFLSQCDKVDEGVRVVADTREHKQR